MPINRTRSWVIPKTGPKWVATYTDVLTTFTPQNLAGTRVITGTYNLHGYSEQASDSKSIADQYPSARSVTGGFSANPARITSNRTRFTQIAFRREGPIGYSGANGLTQSTQINAQGSVAIQPPGLMVSSLPIPYNTVVNVWKPEVVTAFKAEAGNAAAMSIVSMMEFSKTLSLITGAAGRWTKMLEKAFEKDLVVMDRWLSKQKSKRVAINSADKLGKELINIMTNKREFQKLTKRMRSKIRNQARSAKGKIGLYLNGHMELRYGWKTTMYDIEDHFEAAGNVIQPIVTPYKKQSKAKVSFGVLTQTKSVTPARYQSPVTAQFDVEWKITVRAGATIKNEVPEALRKLHAFGLLNPLSSIHELIPLSFIGEWFSNHGTLLKAAENARFNTFYDGWNSVRWEMKSKCVSAGSDTILDAPDSTLNSYERWADLQTSYVVYDDPMNITRWTDVVAIAWGRLFERTKLKHLRI